MEEDIKIAYLCDEKKCINCEVNGHCHHTLDIKHAKNFKLDNGVYFEYSSERLEDLKMMIDETIEELNEMIDKMKIIKKIGEIDGNSKN